MSKALEQGSKHRQEDQAQKRQIVEAYQRDLAHIKNDLMQYNDKEMYSQKRLEVLLATQRNGGRVARTINVDNNVRYFAQQYDISEVSLKSGFMNVYEYHLHKEFLEQLSQAVNMKYFYDNRCHYQELIDAVGYGVSCGIDANNNHQAVQAAQWADFGWQVLDLAQAALEGGLIGVYNTAAFVGNALVHPIDTIKTVAHGAATITQFLARATGAVLRLQVLEERGYHEQLHEELGELTDQIGVVINHCSEQLASIPLREKVKHVVVFGTEIIVPAKAFKVAHTLCLRMRPMITNMLNIVCDEQVAVEIAGIGGENFLLRSSEELQKSASSGAKIIDKIRRPLLATWVGVRALARKFEGRVVVDGRSVHIDYAHLFSIEEMSRVKRSGHICDAALYGWHHDYARRLENVGTVTYENIVQGMSGAFKAKPIVNGVTYKAKTFFSSL